MPEFRDESGVQADFVPEGEEADFTRDVQGPQKDPDSGVTQDFTPDAGAEEEANTAFSGPQRRALEKAVAEDAKAQGREDAPEKFTGPAKDQLGVAVEGGAETVPEVASASAEPSARANPDERGEDGGDVEDVNPGSGEAEAADGEETSTEDSEREPTERPERVGDGSAEQADSAETGDEPDSQEELDGPIEDPS